MSPEEVKAFEGYKAKAEKGDAVAQFKLGFWYRKAADQGYADAQFNLGACYYKGEGVAKDQVEAVKWYRMAADQGDAGAQFGLGVCYYNGEGVAKDQVEAYAFFNLAGITEEPARKLADYLEKRLSPEAVLRGQQRTKELQKEINAKIAANQAGK
jgi:TPR repeat protein